MSIEIVATINFEQYLAALAALQSSGKKRSRYSVPGLAVLVTVSLFLAYLYHRSPALVCVAFFATWVALLAANRWSEYRYRECLRRTYEAQEKQLSGQPMTITREGISGRSADLISSYQYQWASFVRLIDLPDGLLFLPNAVTFVRIPKAPLTSDELLQIMEWWGHMRPKGS